MEGKPKIFYVGNYSKGEGYPRANVLLEGLSGVSNLTEIRFPLWDKKDKEKEIKSPLSLIPSFLKSFLFFLKNSENLKNADIVIVGFPGYMEIFLFKLIKILTGGHYTLVFDYFFSVFESLTMERKVLKPDGFMAKILYFFDKLGLKTADRVLIDTEPHRDYICSLFNIDKDKFIVLPVGESEKQFSFIEYPDEKTPFNVLFFGTFLNLHGIDKIKDAILLLENEEKIKFTLIGKGKNDSIFKESSFQNTKFVNEFIPPHQLKTYIKKSHVILGIFGENDRANMVIPCKIYDALACGRPVITGKTEAVEKSFKNADFVIQCDKKGEAIAKAILNLYQKDIGELKKLGKDAYLFFKENFSPPKIALKLLKEINK